MVSVCKTWSLPSANIVGLCSSKYDPVSGQNDCGVCAKPYYNNTCGCPGVEVDGARLFNLTVEPGVSGTWAPMAAFYGSFRLTNDGLYCKSTVRFGARYWTVEGSTPPTLNDGKLWRMISSLSAYDSGTGQIVAWNIDPLPACSNTTPYFSVPENVSGFDEWFTITLESV